MTTKCLFCQKEIDVKKTAAKRCAKCARANSGVRAVRKQQGRPWRVMEYFMTNYNK